MIISAAIAIKDEVEAHRKKEGDIIAIKPQGWKWGAVELKHYLIVEMDFPESKDINELGYLTGMKYSTDAETGEKTIVGKRQYKVDNTRLQTEVTAADVPVDWTKVADDKQSYQPFTYQEAADVSIAETVTFDPYKLVVDKDAGTVITAAKEG